MFIILTITDEVGRDDIVEMFPLIIALPTEDKIFFLRTVKIGLSLFLPRKILSVRRSSCFKGWPL